MVMWAHIVVECLMWVERRVLFWLCSATLYTTGAAVSLASCPYCAIVRDFTIGAEHEARLPRSVYTSRCARIWLPFGCPLAGQFGEFSVELLNRIQLQWGTHDTILWVGAYIEIEGVPVLPTHCVQPSIELGRCRETSSLQMLLS